MPKPKRTAIAVAPAMVHENYLRACGVMTRLLDEVRISRSRFELLAEVERQLRALLRIRSR